MTKIYQDSIRSACLMSPTAMPANRAAGPRASSHLTLPLAARCIVLPPSPSASPSFLHPSFQRPGMMSCFRRVLFSTIPPILRRHRLPGTPPTPGSRGSDSLTRFAPLSPMFAPSASAASSFVNVGGWQTLWPDPRPQLDAPINLESNHPQNEPTGPMSDSTPNAVSHTSQDSQSLQE